MYRSPLGPKATFSGLSSDVGPPPVTLLPVMVVATSLGSSMTTTRLLSRSATASSPAPLEAAPYGSLNPPRREGRDGSEHRSAADTQFDDAVIPAVGDEEIAGGRVNADAHWAVELPGSGAKRSIGAHRCLRCHVPRLDAIVLRVRDPRIAARDGDGVRVVDIAERGAECLRHVTCSGAPSERWRADRLEDLNVALLRIGDPVVAGGRIDGNTARPVEVTDAREAALAAHVDELTARVEHVDPLVHGVHRDDVAGGIERHPTHLVEHRCAAAAGRNDRRRNGLRYVYPPGLRVNSSTR